MQSRINPVVFLKGLRAAGNRSITPRKLTDISRSVFGNDLTPEQARDHLAEVEADLRPIYSATLRLLGRGEEREGSIQDILSFCKKHQASWSLSVLISNETAREQYLSALVRRFPEASYVSEIKKHPLRFTRGFDELYVLDPTRALTLVDMPESKEVALPADPIKRLLMEIQMYRTERKTVLDNLKESAKSVGLKEIPAHVIDRMQKDCLFALVLIRSASYLGETTGAQRFLELISDPNVEYSLDEALAGVYRLTINFFSRRLSLYKLYKSDRGKYESVLGENYHLMQSTRIGPDSLEFKVTWELCPHMDEIVQVYGLDLEADKIPEEFFTDFIRKPELKKCYKNQLYYKNQLRNILILVHVLERDYRYAVIN